MATEDMGDQIRRAIRVGFDTTGLSALVGVDILDAQAEAGRVAVEAVESEP
jgi:hypothetical protein